ncbi:MAG: PIN domain-containing protein [Nitrococcus sp.]|nr:PIN domain-containing protein [Nitrococcus sp.]
MISLDTNLLLYAFNGDCEEHAASNRFLHECACRDDVAICELVLVEFYQLLRNPAVLLKPCEAAEAVELCQSLRNNPRWALIDSAPIMDQVWKLAARQSTSRRWIFDARIALTLLHHGVTEFATRNSRDFDGFGFKRVWDPTAES